MKDEKKTEATDYFGSLAGSWASKNVQTGTNEAIAGMDLFRAICSEKKNVDFSLKKGNYFEFIEAAKFNRNAANAGLDVRARVTHSDGRPTDPVDIEMISRGHVTDNVQAKVSDSSSHIAYEFKNSKYADMQRITTSDNVAKVRELVNIRANSNNIYQEDYHNAKNNIEESLTDRETRMSSGGTSSSELQKADKSPALFALEFEMNQYIKEVGITAINSAASCAIISTAFSAFQNTYLCLVEKKDVDEALKDIGITATKFALRGSLSGAISSTIRISGRKLVIPFLEDSSVNVALANGLIDIGVSIYSYTKGEIGSSELASQLKSTTLQSAANIYFSRAIALALGTTPLFVPFVVYSLTSSGMAACQSIIKQAKLETDEYNRIASLYMEFSKQIREQRAKIEIYLAEQLEAKQKSFTSLLDIYEESLYVNQNYDLAVTAINVFASDFGLQLKNASFDDFDREMGSPVSIKI